MSTPGATIRPVIESPLAASETTPEHWAGAGATSLQQRKRELVRAALRSAAEDLVAAGRFETTTVEEIARAAGVSRRTFFRYYAAKEDAIVEGSDRLADDLVAAIAKRPLGEPPLVSIQRVLVPLLQGAVAKPELIRGVIRVIRETNALRRAMLERRNRMEERLATLFASRLRVNPLEDGTPALLAFLTRALLDTAFNVWFDQDPDDVGAMVKDLFRKLKAVTAVRRRALASGRTSRRRRKTVRAG
jgi:AcrR family transcriptional regulator